MKTSMDDKNYMSYEDNWGDSVSVEKSNNSYTLFCTDNVDEIVLQFDKEEMKQIVTDILAMLEE